MIVAEYANIFYSSMELENRSILIAGFAGSRWRHRRISISRNPKLGQVSLFTSGLSDAIMLELFNETPKDVTYTLMELANIYWIEMLSYQVIQCYQLRVFTSLFYLCS